MQGVEYYQHISHDADLTNLVIKHAQLIKRIAHQIKYKLPAHIELDDLVQSGLIGLMEAQKKYNEEKGASFETYASIKIRSAILDDLRKNSGITRHISDNMKLITNAKAKLEHEQSDDHIHLSAVSISRELGVSLEKYAGMVSEIDAFKSISINDGIDVDDLAQDDLQNPSLQVEHQEIQQGIKSVIEGLSKREQQILALYYNEQLNFKEIAEILSLTEARISQIHVLILDKIKNKYQYRYGSP